MNVLKRCQIKGVDLDICPQQLDSILTSDIDLYINYLCNICIMSCPFSLRLLPTYIAKICKIMNLTDFVYN